MPEISLNYNMRYQAHGVQFTLPDALYAGPRGEELRTLVVGLCKDGRTSVVSDNLWCQRTPENFQRLIDILTILKGQQCPTSN